MRSGDAWLDRLWDIFDQAEEQKQLNDFMTATISFLAGRIADQPTEQRSKLLALIGDSVAEHDRLNREELQ